MLYSEADCEEYRFELRTSDPFTLTVTFEHPCTTSMASSKFLQFAPLLSYIPFSVLHGVCLLYAFDLCGEFSSPVSFSPCFLIATNCSSTINIDV